MKLEINGETYLVTDMFIVGKEIKVPLRFNVFDKCYKFITSITCKSVEEFKTIFNNYLKNNKTKQL